MLELTNKNIQYDTLSEKIGFLTYINKIQK